MKPIRLLTIDDIEVRVARTSIYDGKAKAELLLYKDARVDMKILDEMVGPENWRRSHKLLGDRLYCSVEIYDEQKGEWISKEDVGVESNTEAQKGQASDAFKRACFNWGIGRELYTAPRIKVDLYQGDFDMENGRPKLKPYIHFNVAVIGYNEQNRSINSLIIVDQNNKERFRHGSASAVQVPPMQQAMVTVLQSKINDMQDNVPQIELKPWPNQETYMAMVKASAEKRLKYGMPIYDYFCIAYRPNEQQKAEFLGAVDYYRVNNNLYIYDE